MANGGVHSSLPAGRYGGSGGDTHIHIHAWDGPSVDRWLDSGGAQKIDRATANYRARGGSHVIR